LVTRQQRAHDLSALDLLRDPAVHNDPYPTYAALREQGPAVWSEALGGYWIVGRYDDISRILLDPRRFSNRRTNLEPGDGGSSREDFGTALLINSDDPEHAVHRRLVRPHFTPRAARADEDRTRAVAVALLERAITRRRFEFMNDVAIPYIGQVFLPVIGIPPADVPWLIERSWAEGMEPGRAAAAPNREELAASEREIRAEIAEYLGGLIEAHKQDPAAPEADFLGLLADAHADGGLLAGASALNMMMVIMNAGLHTTTNTLGNMMVFLAEHPAHRDRLAADPQLTVRAVEELMRYESIITEGRVALEDTDLGGVTIKAGDFVAVPFGSAGRDETRFDRPDEVDFDRTGVSHLQFGLGIHRCLGMHLARMELRIALEEIHRIMPSYRMVPGRPPKRHTGQERGTAELWLEA
jgi:cytochrome P450